MGLLEELAAFKEIIADRGLKGSVSKTTFGYVYNQPFFTENMGEDFEEALEKLKTLEIPE
ncbi:hypothetical protein EZV73_25490 [Acidaminobacter sp. JC074]|uniref:hypothetical protein n=1 Tax=Acidaminobacter sp. JC074 TaxID=2530199 RepID=UPI001F0E3645|nr:hypothetical protein [Acidaminobacter sp. JC074]MCH4890957.1 hypothetical protein [Acidaminobacter sp. JC074]